ncbi:MAG: glycoside hydrolase family 127 protein [Puniceicoccales bacterium]|nr:glycoside hydrolase family 127 protein [Puniceicoccales bacterium]
MKTSFSSALLLTAAAVLAFAPCAANAQGNSVDYPLPPEQYQARFKASDPATWKAATCAGTVPTRDITMAADSLFARALNKNVGYLLAAFSNDHMLFPFRERFGVKNPPDDAPQVKFWDLDLRGSNAGRFMMGAGNTLRWVKHKELRTRLDALIDGIEACREPNGYILAYPAKSPRSEEPNYARAWFTHGLIDAGIAGNPKAFTLLRGHADWFNKWDEMHPKLLRWHNNSHQGHIASTRTYFTPVGKPEDLLIAEKFYVADWWLQDLAARRDRAIWRYPLQNPHCYLITSFEAYLDHYIATGDKAFFDASQGAWDMIHDRWEHVGGSIAICESQWGRRRGRRVLHGTHHPPYSYYLAAKGHTGENCGSVFWIKFNQRFNRLFPDQEKYVNEIEKSIYNIVLASQMADGRIRYHATMQGEKSTPGASEQNTCCEGQGTRLLGSLPEYIYTLAADGVYINLYEASDFRFSLAGKQIALTLESKFPYRPEVAIKVGVSAPVQMKVRVRVPEWAAGKMNVLVNGKVATTGVPGSYVVLSREWKNGDRVSFSLPMALRFTLYRGVDAIAGKKRYAAEYGPILLAHTGSDSVPSSIQLGGAADLKEKVSPVPVEGLRFPIKGGKTQFAPYFSLNKEKFTIFPIVE